MKKMTYFMMALVLVLGLAQCKKEKLETPQNEGNSVMITLDVKGDNNAKVDVNPPDVTFGAGDEIVVACNGHYVGTLKHNGTNFSGPIENATPGEHLYFYFFGNVSPQYFGQNQSNCTVYTGDQTGELPVISMGRSKETVPSEPSGSNYTAILQNKCSLMKFNVETPSTAPICISGMNNFVTVSFDRSGNNDGFSYSQVYDGKIKMKQNGSGTNGMKTYWAIVLPQASVAEGSAYTDDGYIGTRPAIEGGIGINQYYSDGVVLTMGAYNPLTIPLTFEAMTAGATVSLNRAGTAASSAPEVSLETSTDGISWTTYKIDSTITLTNVGDKVMFRGTNARYATGTSAYHNFSLGGDCYVYGNIMSLINATDYATTTSLGHSENNQYALACLFQGCEKLYNSDMTIDLPATGLAKYCYQQMFKDCTHLTVAPELPTGKNDNGDLKESCYQGMFQNCISLEESPELPAKALVSNCYDYMFSGCTSLSHVTCLATSGINQGTHTSSWLSNVADEGTFITAAGVVNWLTSSESGIPENWHVDSE